MNVLRVSLAISILNISLCEAKFIGSDIISSIEDTFTYDGDVLALKRVIDGLSNFSDVSKIKEELSKSKFFVRIDSDVHYNNTNVCDIVILANDYYIADICLDKSINKFVVGSSGVRSKKTEYDSTISPMWR